MHIIPSEPYDGTKWWPSFPNDWNDPWKCPYEDPWKNPWKPFEPVKPTYPNGLYSYRIETPKNYQIKETSDQIIVRMDLCGVEPKNIDILCWREKNETKVRIKFTRNIETHGETFIEGNGNLLSSFSDTLTIKVLVKEGEYKTNYKNGLLEIRLFKESPNSNNKEFKIELK